MGKGEEMFAIGLVLFVVGWLICTLGHTPIQESVRGNFSYMKALGFLAALIGVLMMTVSTAIFAWQRLP